MKRIRKQTNTSITHPHETSMHFQALSQSTQSKQVTCRVAKSE